MKKSLKVIASAAMALSMFSSVAMADTAATTSTTTTAATKTSKDFKDLAGKDAALLAKIDALLASGTFDGVATDTFGIDQNMTRAQVAKVLTLIYNVKVDATVKTSSFSDVKADDTANAWAIPYIEAAKQAGLIDGVTDTTFVPGDNVTLGQFATLLVKGLGKKVDVTGSPWYKDAVDQAVALNLLPAGTDGSKAATRADLVGGAFNGQQAYVDANKPKQVSVVSAKATGVKSVTVNFDRDVDTTKATVSLKRGTVDVATTTQFADDKKSATLTLTDTKVMAADYTVTLGGLDAASIKTATGTFTAQDEQVQKIEFVTSSDTIAKATNVLVKLKATNQYGELASTSSGSYSFFGNVTKLTKSADGYLLATIDSNSATTGVGIVTATIMNTDSHVTVTKNFTVGTEPILSKVELGSARYSNGTAINGTGDNVKFDLNFFDQYGSMINYDTLQAKSGSGWLPTQPVIWNDYLDTATVNSGIEDDGNGNPILKISLNKNVDKSGNYNFTFIDQAASTTGKVSIQSAKIATKVKIGSMTDVIAAGDLTAYVPIEAYDAQGIQLTADDLAKNENRDRIMINSNAITGVATPKLEDSGEHKGQIKLNFIPGQKNGSVSVSVFIATANITSNDTKNFTVQAARIPDHFLEVTAPGKQLSPGGSSAFQYKVIDQYGKAMDTLNKVDPQGNIDNTNGYTYSVSVTAKTYANASAASFVTTTTGSTYLNNTTVVGATYALALVSGDVDAIPSIVGTTNASVAAIDATGINLSTGGDVKNGLNGNTYRFAALNDPAAVGYRIELVGTINKTGGSPITTTELNKFTRSVSVANPTNTDLTYSLNSIATLWNAKDSGVVTDRVYNTGATILKDDMLLNTPNVSSKFARELKVSAKNAAGETVGLPKQIVGVSSSDTNVAYTALVSAGGGNVKKAYVIGNKVGTAKVAISFTTADGQTKTLYADITVKSDALNVATVTWDDNAYNTGVGVNAFSAFTHLNVTDSYGVVYEDSDAQKYNPFLGVTFSVKLSATSLANHDQVTVDNFGNVSITRGSANPVTFDLTANSATGKSATTSITAN